MTRTMTLALTRVSLLSAVLMIPAIGTTDAAPRKAGTTQQAETTGVAIPDAPAVQSPAVRRARASVQTGAGPVEGIGAMNAMPGAQSTIRFGNLCFSPTDSRGYGYWTSCDQMSTFVDHSSDGGGGDGGGGSGGQ
jgi:hypothetical protein